MPSLTQLLASHDRVLVLDAASLQVQVGLLRTGHSPVWEQGGDEAGRSLFSATASALARTGTHLEDINAFIFCEGPGSMLGTRTVAMALRTWLALEARPVFSYQSLALAGTGEWLRSHRRLTVIADARRESWHVQTLAADGRLDPLERRPTADLPPGELLTPAGFRVWSKSPHHVAECSYALPTLFAAASEAELFQSVDTPDAFQPAAPSYKKWSAQAHSAESANPR